MRLYFLCFHCLRRIFALTHVDTIRLTERIPRRSMATNFSALPICVLLTSFIFELKRCWSKSSETQLNENRNSLGTSQLSHCEKHTGKHMAISINFCSLFKRFLCAPVSFYPRNTVPLTSLVPAWIKTGSRIPL